ncbi:MAG: terminase small subunit protein [Methylobacterium sp.]|nr:terminase small subunit protein [Methylobacterium sp.]
MARQSEFTQAVADLICERIADGHSLRSICADEGMPATSTVFKWLNENKPFSDQYARAREAQADALFDEILEIADDGTNDWMERKNDEGENIGWRENGEALRRSALRVEARKWMAGKLQPKKYSDKHQVELSGADGGPVQVEAIRRVIVDPRNSDGEGGHSA